MTDHQQDEVRDPGQEHQTNERHPDERRANERAAEPAGIDLHPNPHYRRIRRGAVLITMLAMLVGLTVLTFRYSRQSLDSQPARKLFERPAATSRPGEPDVLRRMDRLRERDRWLDELRGLAEPPAEGGPAASSPIPHTPARPDRSRTQPDPDAHARRAALQVRRPRRGGARSSATADALQRSAFEDATRQAGTRATAATSLPQPSDPRVLERPSTTPATVTWEPPPGAPVLRQGTYLPAVLQQAVSSELAGLVRAVLSRDVFDPDRPRQVLLPRGTQVLGWQTRQPLQGERRLVVVWNRFLLPDGRSLTVGELPSAAADGALGLRGDVNHRWGRKLGTVALLSLAGAGVQLAQPQGSDREDDPGQVAAGQLGLDLGRLSQEILRQATQLPPIVRLQPGTRIHILLTRDLVFPGS